jgi:hypothetical protein
MVQFLSPWYLAGGLAALLPLVIYLVQRHRAQRVVFGSVWFLRDLAKRIVRRRRAWELVLLLLRMAFLLAVALAFARPFLLSKSAAGRGGAGGIKARAILLDTSASMGVGDRMRDARKAALAAISGLAPGDSVAAYGFGNSLARLAGWTSDHAVARTAVESAKPTDEGTDLSEALRQVQTELLDRPETDREILVVSDMQAVGWADYRGDWTMPRSVSLSFADVGGGDEPPANLGIVQASVPHSSVLGSAQDTISARVQSFTTQDQTVKVTLELQDKEAASTSVPLRAGSSQVVSFPWRFEQPGELAGRFVLHVRDDYAADNQAFFVVAVQPKIRVVVVNGSPSADPQADGGYYLVRAFSPSKESIFEAKAVLPEEWRADDLEGVGAVVLSDVSGLPAQALNGLKAFVRRGGGVIFFPGGKTDPAAFNRLFAEPSASLGPGLAPCRLEKRIDAREEDKSFDGVVIGELDLQHPILQLFAQPHHGDFSTVHFKHYFTVSDSQASTVLARFENKRPAVLLRNVGKGTSLLVASSANQEMNDFSLRGVFVPFVQEAARFQSSAGGRRASDMAVGSEVQVELPPGCASARLVLPTGQEEDLAAEPKRGGGADGLPTAPTVSFLPTAAGIYRVRAGREGLLFAANVDPRESDLRRMKSDEIAAALTHRRGSEEEAGAVLRVTAQKAQREEIENSQRLGWLVLLLAAAMLIGEMVLADRITIRE